MESRESFLIIPKDNIEEAALMLIGLSWYSTKPYNTFECELSEKEEIIKKFNEQMEKLNKGSKE